METKNIDFMGALVAYNSEPIIVENEDDAADAAQIAENSHFKTLTPADGEEFWSEAEKLNLTAENSPAEISVSPEMSFCLSYNWNYPASQKFGAVKSTNLRVTNEDE